MDFLETLSGAPETLTEDAKTKLNALRQQLQTEAATTPFAAIALERLKTVNDRATLAREIQGIQDAREFETMSANLKLELTGLQTEVESFAETGARTLQQQIINPTNAAIDQLPAWAKLSILGMGVGGTLYGGYKMATKAVSGTWKWFKKTFLNAKSILAGIVVAEAGLLGWHFLGKKKKEETPPPTETPVGE